MKGIAKVLGKLNWGKRAYAVFVMCAATALALPAQSFSVVLRLDFNDGAYPGGALVQGTDGNLYGTAYQGGAYCPFGCGTVFGITTTGAPRALYSFCRTSPVCTDGNGPTSALVLAGNGDLYGITLEDGTAPSGGNGAGTVFQFSPPHSLTTLYSFCPAKECNAGSNPHAPLLQAADGDFYGTTLNGGANTMSKKMVGGTVFKITASGAETTLYSFCAQTGCADGSRPYAGLVEGTDGNFYGTTSGGGANGRGGTIFKITPAGALTTLHSFCVGCSDGQEPIAGLIQASDGNFYGTARGGGAFGNGIVFEITPAGGFTILYSFCAQTGCPDGSGPAAALVEASDGNLYGTTQSGDSASPRVASSARSTTSAPKPRARTANSRKQH
jgi:uncharacterized repeat protein (TIGR03803 family)